jgi:hypothetical protein
MMRTERSASGSYRQQVASRQLLHAGLMQAIADMAQDQTNLGNANGYLGWQFTYNNTVLGVHVSTENPAAPPGVSAHILSADLMKYIPVNLQNAVLSAHPHWIYVDPAGTGIPVGRYAYLAVNVSSLLDANCVYKSSTNRWAGADPGEIQLDYWHPPTGHYGLWDVADTNQFVVDWSNNVNYGSLKELADLGGGVTNGLNADLLSHFETFSYAPVELAPDLEPDGKTHYPKLYIGGDLESRMGSIFNTNDPVADQITYGQRLTNILTRSDVMGYHEANNMSAAEVPNRTNGFVNSLLDYISTNTLQRHGFGYPTTKNVPMLCYVGWQPEFKYTKVVGFGSTNYTFTCANTFAFAAYCPPSADATGSDYQAVMTVIGTPAQPTLITSPAGNNSLTYAFTNVVLSSATSLVFSVGLQQRNSYWLIGTTNYVVTYATNHVYLPGTNVSCLSFMGSTAGKGVRFMVSITNIHNTYGQNIEVERVPPDGNIQDGVLVEYYLNNYPTAAGSFSSGISYPQYGLYEWAEAIDPRINWTDPTGTNYNRGPWIDSYWLHSYVDNASMPNYSLPSNTNIISPNWSSQFGFQLTQQPGWLGSTALPIIRFPLSCDCVGTRHGVGWSDSAPSQTNDPTWFFVANRPLQSVGELGYIPLNYWQTVHLYDHQDDNAATIGGPSGGYHHVLDYFTLTPPTNTARRGLVNMNTFDPAVWGTLLNKMPLDDYSASATGICAATAATVGTNLASVAITNTFTALSDLGKMPFFYGSANAVALGAVNELERKAVIRNTAGLLTTRQQIMTIIVEADTLSTSYGWTDTSHASVQGSTMGVFQIWRDSQPDPTVTDPNGQHRFFIHMYKVMTR